ncbi:fibronectin type III domain-containing protein [Candidatus Woesearchaeota archaeon]|nr:fibronectin type III domain-containing protein [Candidatus Woesearchaeota archaeon]
MMQQRQDWNVQGFGKKVSKKLEKIASVWVVLLIILLPLTQAELLIQHTSPSDLSITDTRVVVNWTTSTAADSGLFYTTNTSQGFQSQTANQHVLNHSVMLNNLQPTTLYYYFLQSSNGSETAVANNSGSYYSFTTSNPPAQSHLSTLSNVQAQNITQESVLIFWQTNAPANSTVLYGTNKSLGLVAGDNTLTLNHTVTVTGLQNDTRYYYTVQSSDGIVTLSDDNQGLLYFVDTLAPAIVPITVDPLPLLTNNNRFRISGKTIADAEVQFFVNNRGVASRILETDLFFIKTNTTGLFNGTIILDEGLNTIQVTAKDSHNNKGYAWLNVTVDVQPPLLYLEPLKSSVNTPTLLLQGTATDNAMVKALVAEIVGNVTQLAQETVLPTNGSGYFNTSILLGAGGQRSFNLTILALDLAGNSARYNQIISVDTQAPRIVQIYPDLEKENFHNVFVPIKGNTSEPFVTIFSINFGNRTHLSTDVEQDPWKYFVVRPGPDEYTEWELTGGSSELINLLMGQREFKSDAQGQFGYSNFEDQFKVWEEENSFLVLQEGKNDILFLPVDEAGNQGAPDWRAVTLDSGSSKWSVGKVSTIANEVYFTDLKQGPVTISIVFDLYYLAGDSSQLQNVNVVLVKNGNRMNNDLISNPEDQVVHYDKENNKFVVFAKIRVNQWSGSLEQLLGEIEEQAIGEAFVEDLEGNQLLFDFKAQIGYTIPEIQVQQQEHVFVESQVNLQTPFDASTWLSPEFINKSIKVLDDTLEGLETAIEWAKWGTLVGLGGCIATMTWGFLDKSDTALKAIYWSCDRVACPSVPPDCQQFQALQGAKSTGQLKNTDGQVITVKHTGQQSYQAASGLRLECPDHEYVLEVITQGQKKESVKLVMNGGTITDATTDLKCTNVEQGSFDPAQISVDSSYGVCYQPEFPPKGNYDISKCWPDSTARSLNPYEDIIASTRCGCVTGIWGNLEKLHDVVYGMRQCLVQAQLGEINGAYCERLFAQYSCDLLYYAIGFVLENTKEGRLLDFGGDTREDINAEGTKKRVHEIQENMANRYRGVFTNQFGLGPDKFIKSACIAAITADWSSLADSVLASFRQPVEPMFGPLMPSSRITAYNPFSGGITVEYLYTLGILSGGQRIDYEVRLWCDPDKEDSVCGNFCPKDGKVYEMRLPGAVGEGQSVQVTRNLPMEDAQLWYNQLDFTATFKVGDQLKQYTQTENIKKKGCLIEQCHFTPLPPAFVCENFGQDEFGTIQVLGPNLLSERSPKVPTYYNGNPLVVKLTLRNINNYFKENRELKLQSVLHKQPGSAFPNPDEKTTSIMVINSTDSTTTSETFEGEGIANVKIVDFEKIQVGVGGDWPLEVPLSDKNIELAQNGKLLMTIKDYEQDTAGIPVHDVTVQMTPDTQKPRLEPNNDGMVSCSETPDSTSKIRKIECINTGEKRKVTYFKTTLSTSAQNVVVNVGTDTDESKYYSGSFAKPASGLTGLQYADGQYKLELTLLDEENKPLLYDGKNQTIVTLFNYVNDLNCPNGNKEPSVDLVWPGQYYKLREKNAVVVNTFDKCNTIAADMITIAVNRKDQRLDATCSPAVNPPPNPITSKTGTFTCRLNTGALVAFNNQDQVTLYAVVKNNVGEGIAKVDHVVVDRP